MEFKKSLKTFVLDDVPDGIYKFSVVHLPTGHYIGHLDFKISQSSIFSTIFHIGKIYGVLISVHPELKLNDISEFQIVISKP